MKKALVFLFLILLLIIPGTASAQSYYFAVERLTVDAFWNENGTLDLLYEFVFVNQPGAHVIDYVDVGLPNYNFYDSDVTATLNGQPLWDISSSNYEGSGSGVGVGLGADAIPPGGRGTVQVFIPGIQTGVAIQHRIGAIPVPE